MRRLAVFGWPVAGLCVTLLEALLRQAVGTPFSTATVIWRSVGWLEWALLAPVIVALGRRFPFRPHARWRFFGVHALAALAVSLAHMTLYFLLRTIFRGAPGRPGQSLYSLWIESVPYHFAMDLPVYGGTLIVTQIALLLEASRKRDQERLELERALAGAELDAFKLQLPVEAVTGRLREIERAIDTSVERAEELIEQFSADLRQSLEIVRMHAAVDEIAQDEQELVAELPRLPSLPVLALLLFALLPAAQLFLDLMFMAAAAAGGRPLSWTVVLQNLGRATTGFPLTVLMVWLGTRVQRIALLAAAAAILPVTLMGGLDFVLGGWDVLRREITGTSRVLEFLLYFVVTLVALAWTRYRAWRAKAIEIAELESKLLRTRASILRLQLNPHFLFNALNSVAALLEDDAAGAATMLAQLRQFVGRVLENSDRDEVPLREELELLTAYVAIENVRFDGRVQLDVRADDDARGALVPSFFLQPLVENALRHGLEPERGGRVHVRASVDDGTLHIEVHDNGRSGDAVRPPREGVGLSNTRARLAQLYGDEFSLQTGAQRDGFGVTVGFPYRTSVVSRK